MTKIVVADIEPPACTNGRHIKPGDLFFVFPDSTCTTGERNVCCSCLWEDGELNYRELIVKHSTSNDMMRKRGNSLDEWAKFRKRGLQLVSWNRKSLEIDQTIANIQFQCYQEGWVERLQRLHRENGHTSEINIEVKKRQKRQRKSAIKTEN